jgi:hypothetical protein
MLNILGKGDISKESYDEIVNLCKRCSRGASRNRSNSRDTTFSRIQKSASGGATRAEIGNLLEGFKTKMLISFASQIDTLQIQKKQERSRSNPVHILFSMQRQAPMKGMSIGQKANLYHL